MNYSIVLSLGRSGTQWLAELLDLQDNIQAIHEMEKDDQLTHGLYSYELSKLDAKFWKEIGKYYHDGSDHLIDVNCRYRYHCGVFEQDPEINTAYMVRNGVKVVASYMDRDNPYEFPKWTVKAKPRKIPFDKWINMSRFERVCRGWQHGNAVLINNASSKLSKLEKINESYDYFCSNICSPLDIKVDKEHWEEKRKNPSHQGHGPHSREFEEWDDWKQETFTSICGELMEELGYW